MFRNFNTSMNFYFFLLFMEIRNFLPFFGDYSEGNFLFPLRRKADDFLEKKPVIKKP